MRVIKYMRFFQVLLILLISACSTRYYVTFDIKDDIGANINEVTVTMENHDGNPANVYTRTSDQNTVSFHGFLRGTYTVRVTSTGLQDYTIPALEVNTPNISQQVTLQTMPGRIIAFSRYNWRILDVQADKILLITNRIIAERPFDQTSNIWENSEIRRYLNTQFYDSFSPADRARIIPHSTGDQIFLLSIDEIQTFFDSKNYFHANPDRVARNSKNSPAFWWLRTPGTNFLDTSCVLWDGSILSHGRHIKLESGGLRPALWVDTKGE